MTIAALPSPSNNQLATLKSPSKTESPRNRPTAINTPPTRMNFNSPPSCYRIRMMSARAGERNDAKRHIFSRA